MDELAELEESAQRKVAFLRAELAQRRAEQREQRDQDALTPSTNYAKVLANCHIKDDKRESPPPHAFQKDESLLRRAEISQEEASALSEWTSGLKAEMAYEQRCRQEVEKWRKEAERFKAGLQLKKVAAAEQNGNPVKTRTAPEPLITDDEASLKLGTAFLPWSGNEVVSGGSILDEEPDALVDSHSQPDAGACGSPLNAKRRSFFSGSSPSVPLTPPAVCAPVPETNGSGVVVQTSPEGSPVPPGSMKLIGSPVTNARSPPAFSSWISSSREQLPPEDQPGSGSGSHEDVGPHEEAMAFRKVMGVQLEARKRGIQDVTVMALESLSATRTEEAMYKQERDWVRQEIAEVARLRETEFRVWQQNGETSQMMRQKTLAIETRAEERVHFFEQRQEELEASLQEELRLTLLDVSELTENLGRQVALNAQAEAEIDLLTGEMKSRENTIRCCEKLCKVEMEDAHEEVASMSKLLEDRRVGRLESTAEARVAQEEVLQLKHALNIVEAARAEDRMQVEVAVASRLNAVEVRCRMEVMEELQIVARAQADLDECQRFATHAKFKLQDELSLETMKHNSEVAALHAEIDEMRVACKNYDAVSKEELTNQLRLQRSEVAALREQNAGFDAEIVSMEERLESEKRNTRMELSKLENEMQLEQEAARSSLREIELDLQTTLERERDVVRKSLQDDGEVLSRMKIEISTLSGQLATETVIAQRQHLMTLKMEDEMSAEMSTASGELADALAAVKKDQEAVRKEHDDKMLLRSKLQKLEAEADSESSKSRSRVELVSAEVARLEQLVARDVIVRREIEAVVATEPIEVAVVATDAVIVQSIEQMPEMLFAETITKDPTVQSVEQTPEMLVAEAITKEPAVAASPWPDRDSDVWLQRRGGVTAHSLHVDEKTKASLQPSSREFGLEKRRTPSQTLASCFLPSNSTPSITKEDVAHEVARVERNAGLGSGSLGDKIDALEISYGMKHASTGGKERRSDEANAVGSFNERLNVVETLFARDAHFEKLEGVPDEAEIEGFERRELRMVEDAVPGAMQSPTSPQQQDLQEKVDQLVEEVEKDKQRFDLERRQIVARQHLSSVTAELERLSGND